MSQKCVFQFVHGEDGRRSPPITIDRYEFASGLKEDVNWDSPQLDVDMVLVLAELTDNEAQGYRFSTAPMMTVRHFINAFGG